MSDKLIRKSLELTSDQWQQLNKLADLHHTLARNGPGRNLPSWRILVRQIADGTLIVTTKKEIEQ